MRKSRSKPIRKLAREAYQSYIDNGLDVKVAFKNVYRQFKESYLRLKP